MARQPRDEAAGATPGSGLAKPAKRSALPPPEEIEPTSIDHAGAETSPGLPSAALAAQAAAPAPTNRRRLFRSRTGTSAEIWRLAWPVMLSQVLVSIISLVDIAMVGRLGPDAQAAVGYASQLFFLAQSAFFAIGGACVALMARAIGAGDPAVARRALAGSLAVSGVAGLLFAAALLAAPHTVLGWLSAEPDVIELCVPYLELLMISGVLLALCLVFDAGLRANRDTVTPMGVALVVTVVKIALNALLIFGLLGFPRLELVGAGLATLLAQGVALGLFVAVLRRAPADSPVALRRGDLAGSRPLLGDLMRVTWPGVAERLLMNVALLAYFAILGGYGTIAVATYTVGVRLLSFSWIPGTGYATAVATLVGQSLGARDEEGAERAGWRAARLSLITAAALGLACAVWREPLARLFTADADTIQTLGPFMLCLAIAQPVLQLHFTLGGAHRGAGDTVTPLVAAFVSNWLVRVPLAVLFARVLDAPLVWVWAVMIVDHLARALWLTVSFWRGGWRTRLARPGEVPA